MRTIMLKKMALQALFILMLACIFGIGANSIRKGAIPMSSVSQDVDLSMDIDTAKKLFYKGKAIFVDARPYGFYKRLHIKGAINMHPGEEEKLKKMNLPDNKVIITYCDDRTCGLSKELAMELYSLGLDNVYYLKDGLDTWISQSLPVEKSK